MQCGNNVLCDADFMHRCLPFSDYLWLVKEIPLPFPSVSLQIWVLPLHRYIIFQNVKSIIRSAAFHECSCYTDKLYLFVYTAPKRSISSVCGNCHKPILDERSWKYPSVLQWKLLNSWKIKIKNNGHKIVLKFHGIYCVFGGLFQSFVCSNILSCQFAHRSSICVALAVKKA